MRRLLPLSALLVLTAIAVEPASAATGQSVGGVVTVTGTAGKDELQIRVSSQSSGTEFSVTPAATVTSTGGSGTCSPDTDPQTGRPTRTRCSTATISSLVLNLLGGDDDVTVDDSVGNIQAATANAGPGNDVVNMVVLGGRTFNGDIGDDTFEIRGPQTTSTTTFNGGAGSDRATFGSMSAQLGVPISITGSLQTNQVQLKRNETNGTLTTFRTDSLSGIEEIQGTPLGDALTGGSTVANELVGGEGPDNLTAGSVDTILDGGPGLDQLAGAGGADTFDGGTGIDSFRAGGRDTLLMRDGYAETVECVGGNTVINDLADAVTAPASCTSIQTAAAKHKHDTTIAQRRLKIAPAGGTAVRLKCPLRKVEPCVGLLRLKAGRTTLAKRSYLILQGTAKLLRFQFSKREAARATASKVEILGEETDDDGRPRAVMRRVPARRKRA